MDIVDLIVYAAVCLIGGGCIGYALGRESPRRCADCLSNNANRYADGHRDGYRDGVQMTVERVRVLGIETRNTYTIAKDELERIEHETAE